MYHRDAVENHESSESFKLNEVCSVPILVLEIGYPRPLEPVYDLFTRYGRGLQRVICSRSCRAIIKKDDAEKTVPKRHHSGAV